MSQAFNLGAQKTEDWYEFHGSLSYVALLSVPVQFELENEIMSQGAKLLGQSN